MSIREMARLIDREGTLASHDGIGVRVRIDDVRVAYGNQRVRVSPVAGDGHVWVDLKRVTLAEGEGA